MKNNNDSNRSLIHYLILGSVVMFLLILSPISFFYVKNMIFILVVLGFLVLFAVIFKGFRNENRKTLDFLEKDVPADVHSHQRLIMKKRSSTVSMNMVTANLRD